MIETKLKKKNVMGVIEYLKANSRPFAAVFGQDFYGEVYIKLKFESGGIRDKKITVTEK